MYGRYMVISHIYGKFLSHESHRPFFVLKKKMARLVFTYILYVN